MKTLWLLQYNNYYNRILKKEANLSAYQGHQVKYKGQTTDTNGNTAVIQSVNFIEGDFVNTTQVVNWGGDIPDYLLAIDEEQNINSRWFVVDATKTRSGQLSLTLHRDLVADYEDEILTSPAFVEKATLDQNSPLIYNSEDMTFNQIKRGELPLKDDSQCPWIVLYTDQKTRLSVEVGANDGIISTTYASEAEFEASPVYQVWGRPDRKVYDTNYTKRGWTINLAYSPANLYAQMTYYSADAPVSTTNGTAGASSSLKTTIPASRYSFTSSEREKLKEMAIAGENAMGVGGLIADWRESGALVDASIYNECVALSNQVVRVSQNSGGYKYYRITCNYTSEPVSISISSQAVWTSLKNKGVENGILRTDTSQPTVAGNEFKIYAPVCYVNISEVNADALSLDVAPMEYTQDAPYNILAIPYSDTLKIKNSAITSFKTITASKTLAMNVAKSLILSYAGAGALYDAQILPYCPFRDSLIDPTDNTLDINSSNASAWVPIATSSGEIKAYILRCSYASFSFDIRLSTPVTIQNYKIEGLTDIYRISSPNFSSIFEFNAAKNYGINGFTASCTYKPFTPYIKVHPWFRGLYGYEFDDARGLILGGDYSLPMTTDAWKTYELQNKNYQASFDRQISSMEISNNIARQQERWQVAAGAISATTQGAITGGSFGGAGAIMGGLGAGILSTAAGMKDIELNDRMRREALSLTKDQFGYSLGNIKALPIGLSKTSAYNIDNKYFPFVEYFTCTETEKIALAEKIRNNGMTVMTIGTWGEYRYNSWKYTPGTFTDPEVEDRGYFKAKLIKMNGNIPAHIADAIATEIYQGVYLR